MNRPSIVLRNCEYLYSETLQSLWSGYGEIARYVSAGQHSVVVKQVSPPEQVIHPRGWNSDFSHQRKLRSYLIEQHFYEHYGPLCDASCRVPELLRSESSGATQCLVLEDIDAAGFAVRHTQGNIKNLSACLRWLAYFHARFLSVDAIDLWPTGGYWHLATRPDELANMADSPLKAQAGKIDAQLNSSAFQTLVHGDAKLANFCFSGDEHQVVALDFQYVGAGVGIKDVVLLLASSLGNSELMDCAHDLLQHYFSQLQKALEHYNKKTDFEGLKANWMLLYPYAWADYQRFLEGWKPGHSRITEYIQAMTESAMANDN